MCSEGTVDKEDSRLRVWYPARFRWAPDASSLPEGRTLVPVGEIPMNRLRARFGVMAECMWDCYIDDQIPVYHVEGTGDCVALEQLDWLGESALKLTEAHYYYASACEGPQCDPSCKALVPVCMLRHCACLTKADGFRPQHEVSHE